MLATQMNQATSRKVSEKAFKSLFPIDFYLRNSDNARFRRTACACDYFEIFYELNHETHLPTL
jgi:hypothetical protein